jgi:hypothetical protein
MLRCVKSNSDNIMQEVHLRPDPELASIASWPELMHDALRPANIIGIIGGDDFRTYRQPPAIMPSLLGHRRRQQQHGRSISWGLQRCVLTIAVTTVLVGCVAMTIAAWLAHPLLPLRWRTPEWCSAWLMASAANAYGSNLCFCVIVLGTERRRLHALCWCMLLAAGGPPALYLLRWLLQHGQVSLRHSRDGALHSSEVLCCHTKRVPSHVPLCFSPNAQPFVPPLKSPRHFLFRLRWQAAAGLPELRALTFGNLYDA